MSVSGAAYNGRARSTGKGQGRRAWRRLTTRCGAGLPRTECSATATASASLIPQPAAVQHRGPRGHHSPLRHGVRRRQPAVRRSRVRQDDALEHDARAADVREHDGDHRRPAHPEARAGRRVAGAARRSVVPVGQRLAVVPPGAAPVTASASTTSSRTLKRSGAGSAAGRRRWSITARNS